MRIHAIILGLLVILITYIAFLESKMPILEGSKEPLPTVLWRDFPWPLLMQSLVIFATVIAIISLIRERIMR